MPEKSLEKLRALLKSYAERTAKGAAAAKPVPGEADRRRQSCGERLQKVVRTVLQQFRDELKNAGHEAAIDDHTDTTDAYPSVALAFTPRAPGALASALVFRYDPRRGIAVGRDIKPSPTKGPVVTTSTDRIGTMRVEAVSADWVATKTLSFIEAVLKVN